MNCERIRESVLRFLETCPKDTCECGDWSDLVERQYCLFVVPSKASACPVTLAVGPSYLLVTLGSNDHEYADLYFPLNELSGKEDLRLRVTGFLRIARHGDIKVYEDKYRHSFLALTEKGVEELDGWEKASCWPFRKSRLKVEYFPYEPWDDEVQRSPLSAWEQK